MTNPCSVDAATSRSMTGEVTGGVSRSAQHDVSTIPLILIHGFPVDSRMWGECARQIEQIADSRALRPFPIWAPDMPGAGAGPIPTLKQTGRVAADGAYIDAMDRLAEAYVSLIRGEGYDKAVWVGLSMGGYVVLDIQRLYPETVAGVGLCDTKADADSKESRARRLRIAETCEKEHTVEPVMHFATPQPGDSTVKRSDEFIALFTRWIRQQPPEGIAWRQRMAAGRPDLNDQLPEITTPTALISGENDPSSPPSKMRELARQITNAQVNFTAIEDCGHFSAVERPHIVAQALVDLMAKVQSV